jgi:hypothetical protein
MGFIGGDLIKGAENAKRYREEMGYDAVVAHAKVAIEQITEIKDVPHGPRPSHPDDLTPEQMACCIAGSQDNASIDSLGLVGQHRYLQITEHRFANAWMTRRALELGAKA